MMEPEDPAMKGAVQALRDSGVEVWTNVFNIADYNFQDE